MYGSCHFSLKILGGKDGHVSAEPKGQFPIRHGDDGMGEPCPKAQALLLRVGLSARGAHSTPKRNLANPVFAINGTPLAKRNTVIVASAKMENIAEKRNTPRMTFSLALMNTYRFFILFCYVSPNLDSCVACICIVDVLKVFH